MGGCNSNCGCGSSGSVTSSGCCGGSRRSRYGYGGGLIVGAGAAIAASGNLIPPTPVAAPRTFYGLAAEIPVAPSAGTIVVTLYRTPAGGSEVAVASVTFTNPAAGAILLASPAPKQAYAAGDSFRIGYTVSGLSGTFSLTASVGTH